MGAEALQRTTSSPVGNLFVRPHQASVDVLPTGSRVSQPRPDRLAVIEVRVDEDGGACGKVKAVTAVGEGSIGRSTAGSPYGHSRERVCHRDVHRRVLAILGEVKYVVRHDTADIVLRARVVERRA